MRSPFADRREDILPRSLAELLAAEASHAADEPPRRRQRRTRTVRRVT
ncbi:MULTISPECIES: hypothetical protein [Actinomadura]|jgi:hypothetical protein|uniref:Uncharacterized protein n=1 Tax=Actinomadura citrea TaxID=46158 RepID=A0A7Y9G4A2_9ACTN|nr:hypothetical protein [Actinomadura citrea]NYE09720.1 hypothetical protein [Actinomadura citrea]GGT62901.1 hypothetical protein GCM10010177_19930 [Actinomadura citrea]